MKNTIAASIIAAALLGQIVADRIHSDDELAAAKMICWEVKNRPIAVVNLDNVPDRLTTLVLAKCFDWKDEWDKK